MGYRERKGDLRGLRQLRRRNWRPSSQERHTAFKAFAPGRRRRQLVAISTAVRTRMVFQVSSRTGVRRARDGRRVGIKDILGAFNERAVELSDPAIAYKRAHHRKEPVDGDNSLRNIPSVTRCAIAHCPKLPANGRFLPRGYDLRAGAHYAR